MLVGEDRVDHIDMNFGCPVRKVTSKGGGAAIPLKPRLLRNIVRAAVAAAGAVPVTIKFRMGIDDRHLTYLDAGRIGEEEGCAAVGLHARTAAQLYDGEARWDAIAALKQAVTRIPVLGNGDIWEAEDALRMMRTTGCDGVIVGRGCLGRPWLFRDLADVFDGREPANPPDFGGVVDVMLEHARLLVRVARARKTRCARSASTRSWYTKGFRGGAPLRQQLMQVHALRRARIAFWPPSTGRNRSRPTRCACPAARPPARRRWRCPRAISTTSTTRRPRALWPRWRIRGDSRSHDGEEGASKMSDAKVSPSHPAWWVPSLYFAEGLPFFAISLIAGLLYKRRGVPNDVIALYTSWLLLPWSLKPLWSPLLEMFRTKKFFVVLTQFLGGVSLALIALCLPLPDYFRYTLALFTVVAFCSSTHDIAADGLYIASLSQKDQAAYAGWQGGFYNVARFFSQGGLVILAGYLEARFDVTARLDGDLRRDGADPRSLEPLPRTGRCPRAEPSGTHRALPRWRRRFGMS